MRNAFSFAVVILIAIQFALVSCFTKREKGEKEPIGETTNPAVNPLLTDDDEVVEKDEKFIVETLKFNQTEKAFARLALKKTKNQELKNFAGKLEQDHTTAMSGLKKIAANKNITLPVVPGDLKKAEMEELEAISREKEFNEEWLEEIVAMHEKSVNKLEEHLDDTEDRELQMWINETLPIVKGHLDKGKTLEEKMD